MYNGKFDAPTGQPAVVKETGFYTGEVRVKYDEIVGKLEKSGGRLTDFVNAAWPHYTPDKVEFSKYPAMIKEASKERILILKDLDNLKKELQKSGLA